MKARERILKAAAEQFYKTGYPATGVGDILKVAEAHKASFYKYFKNKEELGLAYITAKRRLYANLFRSLMKAYPRYADFVNQWINILKAEAGKGNVSGCAFALLYNQTLISRSRSTEAIFLPEIQGGIQDWETIFFEYLMENLKRKRKARRISSREETSLRQWARRMVLLYEGALQAYAMTGKEIYFEDLRDCLLMAPILSGRAA
ncbi:MAG: TetR/AcrR family transcriptional regulator [Spirochaetia bacterium]|nr:TetR/AcrR family transcriptional regulator [Spirochaetia bacterium]